MRPLIHALLVLLALPVLPAMAQVTPGTAPVEAPLAATPAPSTVAAEPAPAADAPATISENDNA